MASSGNFMTFNRLAYQNSYSASYSKLDTGNLQGNATAGGWGWPSNFTFDSGKWYCEFYVYRRSGASIGYVGVVDHYYPHIDAKYNDNRHQQPTVQDYTVYYLGSGTDGTATNTHIINNQTNGSNPSQTFADSRWADGTIVGVALDLDSSTQTVKFYKNGSAVGNSETLNASASGNWAFWAGSHNQTWFTMNAGQDSSFAGRATAQGNADENGFGDFYYTPPSGFLAPCSANLPISDDIDPAQTENDYPAKQFNVATWTGNSTNDTAIDLDMAPDLVVIKERGADNNWYWIDSTRGVTNTLQSNSTGSTHTESGVLNAFTSTGFTIGTSGGSNNNNDTYCGWGWRANGGTTASNSDGDITSTVQANTKAGFSIVTYTGNRTGTGVSTVGHGLSSAPDMVITKSSSDSGNWWVQHIGTSTASKMFNLQSGSAEIDKSGNGTLSRPTATVFGTNYTDGLGTNGQTHIAYCWHNVEGYSKFGSYFGNANADGPFIYTGFRPRLLVIKKGSGSNDWSVLDTARTTNNPCSKFVRWESNTAEFENTSKSIDILSNGFKIRNSNDVNNGSGGTYIYMAWGDVPFKYNNTF